MSNTHYLALTIGPIYKTIERARKTRELWASSYLLSQYMRILLTKIQAAGIGEALSPSLEELDAQNKERRTWHGAGIWNDNCFFKLPDADGVAKAKKELPLIIKAAKSELFDLILLDIGADKWDGPKEDALRKILSKHFHCHAAIWESDGNKPIIETLSKLTNSAEMLDQYPGINDDFVSKAMFRGKAVKGLYNLGFSERDEVFTYYINKFDKTTRERRIPSLLEIALREYRKDAQFYENKIARIISKNSQEGDDVENEQEEREIITLLKGDSNDARIHFKKRHKYVAVVQADGDGVGSIISGEKDESKVLGISKKLMAFSTAAVQNIFDYDGLPVYAGGDDLLFIAPLQNKNGENLFQLIQKIDDTWNANKPTEKSSVSFGVSIFYYKDPLGEALANARQLLNVVAKKLATESTPTEKVPSGKPQKDALAFRVMLSGQAFATVLHKHGTAWEKWKKLMEQHAIQSDAAFVAGVVHTLERLGWLLEDACKNRRTEAFFDHHFNEAKGDQKAFIQTIKEFAEAIHADYGTLFPEGCGIEETEKAAFYAALQQDNQQDGLTDETRFRNNLLYAALRMIQFLNAEDHE
jgi:CRISPR-associated protein Cmr2